FIAINMRDEYPPHTPCWCEPLRRFLSAMLPRENVASIEFATAYEKSLSYQTFLSEPPVSASPRSNAWPSTMSLPAYKNTPSPPCVALLRTNTFSEQRSNIRIPAESWPRQYTSWL